ncbi:MAG: signal peptide peptidase SppA [Candidatus Burarchaeum sp.]|nr:signal peptide peptidase SppA [Candidatus Burarchaeum sp.]MDO8339774.1 signal peptide peptidase SppA [Candidatus Burarchaeum sp.]
MEKKDALFVLLLVIGALIFIIAPLLFLLSASLPQPACVGLVNVDGEIVTSAQPSLFSEAPLSSDSFSELLNEAAKRDEIKAVVFQINSPGGSVVASQEMYSAAKELKKPKVMYIREMGASGAFYLAMAGDSVISHPDSLTGNIGARMALSDMSGLLEKLGINMTNIKSGEMKDIGAFDRPATEAELAVLQGIVNESFGEFKQIVLDARSGKPRFSYGGFNTVLDGRVLTGRQAYALGLVDELGSKDDAIKEAAKLGGITDEEPRVCVLSSEKSFFEALTSSSSQSLSSIFANALKGLASSGTGGASLRFQ